MKDLPIELIGAVVQNISFASDLLSLRAVNSTCHYLATPYVFRKLHIHNSLQSAQNCGSILQTPSLAAHVREVIYDARDHAQFCLLPPDIQGDCDELEIAELEEALTETFCALPGFINLESVVLNFWPSFRSQCGTEVQEHPFWFTNRQVTVMHAVHHAMQSCRIRSLALNNVVLMSSACYDFVSALTDSPLHHFSMTIVANSELGAWSGSKALNGSVGSLIPASNANLKSLVIRSPQGLYHSLNTQLQSTHYPALEHLVLEHIVFDPTPSAGGIEELIVRHKASLRRLELRGCSSYVPSLSAPVRRWSTIWKRFEDELVSLAELVVDDGHQSYALLDGNSGYIPHPSFGASSVERVHDEAHYARFRDGVSLRSAVRH